MIVSDLVGLVLSQKDLSHQAVPLGPHNATQVPGSTQAALLKQKGLAYLSRQPGSGGARAKKHGPSGNGQLRLGNRCYTTESWIPGCPGFNALQKTVEFNAMQRSIKPPEIAQRDGHEHNKQLPFNDGSHASSTGAQN